MAMSKIDKSTLKPWDSGKSVGKCFESLFSFTEKVMANALGGLPMGVNPEREARETLLSLARMIDLNGRRAVVQTEDQNEGILIDIVAYKGKKLWSEIDASEKCGEQDDELMDRPLVFLRYAYHTKAEVSMSFFESMVKSMPEEGSASVKCGTKEELDIIRKLLEENAQRIAPSLKIEIEKNLPRPLRSIPGARLSFLTPPALKNSDIKPKKKPSCELCKTETKLSCSRCKIAFYCSRECQKQHWREGHKSACKSPEDVAKGMSKCSIEDKDDSDDPWIDIDPKKTDSKYGNYCSVLPTNQPLRNIRRKPKVYNVKTSIEDRPGPSMMKIKVQVMFGQPESAYSPMLIYNKGRDFNVAATKDNISSGKNGYSKLFRLIQTEGYQGMKIYLDAYVKEDGLLRVLLNNASPLLSW